MKFTSIQTTPNCHCGVYPAVAGQAPQSPVAKRGCHIKYGMTVLCLLFFSLNIQAQTIIDDLQKQGKAGEGVIKVEVADPAINARIGRPDGSTTVLGYRIQAFMGSRPGIARKQADQRHSAIREAYPELSCYLTYNAPNWKLTVGDFISREEARLMIQKMRKQFPEFGKELYIVEDKIKVTYTE